MDKNEFFRRGTEQICKSLEIETVLGQCYKFLGGFIPLKAVTFNYYDHTKNTGEIIATKENKNLSGSRTIVMSEEDSAYWRQLWSEEDAVKVVNHPGKGTEQAKLFEKYGFETDISFMLLRLELDGKRIGTFSAAAQGTGRYTMEHAELLCLLRPPLSIAMANALRHRELQRMKQMVDENNRALQKQLRETAGTEIIGVEFGLRHVMAMIRQVAPMDSPILLFGETGTGKGMLADALHRSSPRRDGPFITVNCGAIPESLVDGELFGHEKGAFTGALEQKKGRFERAHGGTIFLDEIGELPPQTQVRLLSVLQNKVIERVGGTESIPLDIRIISATHRNLEEMVKKGEFREDLLYRLNVFPVIIPPLRQRREDIPALVHHFIEKKSVELKKIDRPELDKSALKSLTAYNWPGNVRELQNVVERALLLHKQGPLFFTGLLPSVGSAMAEAVSPVGTDSVILPLDEMIRAHIERALSSAKGKISGPGGAAEILEIYPGTLRKRMDRLGIVYKKKDMVR